MPLAPYTLLEVRCRAEVATWLLPRYDVVAELCQRYELYRLLDCG